MNKSALLGKLPAFTNRSVLIERNQGVGDIIREVVAAHKAFAADYDLIAPDFEQPTLLETCQALFTFCKQNIRYEIETDKKQTTKSPAAIIALGDTIGGDCKHYAGFIAGVLDALRRLGYPIEWAYRFASYNIFDSTPQHVFVVVFDKGQEIWIDPVLSSFNERSTLPYHKPIDKRPYTKNNSMLYRISGISEEFIPAGPLARQVASDVPLMETGVIESDPALTPDLENSIRVLLYYGVMNTEGKINDRLLQSLASKVDASEFTKITNAREVIQAALQNGAAIGNVFSTIWRGVKKVSLALPRNAFLSLVALNVFGYGTKLKNAIFKADGSFFQPNQDKLYNKWHSLGGDWKNLENAIKSGMKKPAVLGTMNQVGVVQAAVPAWVATAGAIIAAIMPLVKELLAAKGQAGALEPGIDATTGLPYGITEGSMMPGSGGFDPIGWLQSHPLQAVAGAGLLYFIVKRGRI